MFLAKVDKKELLYLLKIAKIASTKNTAKSSVELETIDNGIKITSSDFDNYFSSVCPAETEQGSKVILPLVKFYEIIDRLEGLITLRQEDSTSLIIENGETVFNLLLMNGEDSLNRNIIKHSFDSPIAFDRNELLTAARQVITARQPDEFSSSILRGINFHFDDNSSIIELCATDGNRLAISKVKYNGEKQNNFICPVRLLEIIKTLSDEQISLTTSENSIGLKTNNVTFVSCKIDGTFPSYAKLIPRNFEKTASINRDCFLDAIYKIILLADEKTNIVRLKFEGSSLFLSSSGAFGNSSIEIAGIESDFTEEFNIAFNYKFLLDCAKANLCEKLTFRLTTELAACMVDGDFKTLIMPIRA